MHPTGLVGAWSARRGAPPVVYWTERATKLVDGQEAVVTRVFCKRLVDGEWRSLVQDQISLAG